ncbi:MAG: hypothetical protein LLG08_10340 [Actinomycetia bacterium]|nr:hypothetical protein [Actinomycetes bacterium]
MSFPVVTTDASGLLDQWVYAKFGDKDEGGDYYAMISLSKTGAASTYNSSVLPIVLGHGYDHRRRAPANTTGTPPTGGTSHSATTGSSPAAPIPSGAKGSAGIALPGDAGVGTALDGPLEAAAGQVLAVGAGSMPGLPGPGVATGETGGTAAALGRTYLAGFAWHPAGIGPGPLMPSRARVVLKARD